MANYACTITGHGFAESKEKKTPSVKLSLKAHTDLDTGNAVDKTFYADLWLSDKCIDRTCATLREIGYNENSLAAINDGNVLVGAECEVSTEYEDYNGESRERVRFVNRAGNYASRGVKPMDATQARAVAAKYDRFLKNTPKLGDKVAAQHHKDAPPMQQTYEDDSLPF